MLTYLFRRLLILPVTLLGESVIIFSFLLIIGPEERASFYLMGPPKSPAVLEGIIKRYGFREPVPQQYWDWLVGKTDPETGKITGGILRGDFGFSRFGAQPVLGIIRNRFPATVELALYSLVPILLVGVWLGVISAVHHNRWIDQAARLFGIVGYSLPSFIVGFVLLMFFYAELGWFPVGRVSDWVRLEVLAGGFPMHTGMFTVDAVLNRRWDVLWDAVRHLVLPVLTLSYISIAAFLRITRSSMLDALHQDFIVTARAKGLPERALINRHALPNALLPVVTYAGVIVGSFLSGVVITEMVFQFPGMGYAAATAAAQFDVVTVLGIMLVAGLLVIVCNLVVDLLYAVLDPRIRLG